MRVFPPVLSGKLLWSACFPSSLGADEELSVVVNVRRHFLYRLRSNYTSVQEFILIVGEEKPLERLVSDKSEIERFTVDGLSPRRRCLARLWSRETPELSETSLFHYASAPLGP